MNSITDIKKNVVKKTLESLLLLENSMSQTSVELYLIDNLDTDEEYLAVEGLLDDLSRVRGEFQKRVIEWCAGTMGIEIANPGYFGDGFWLHNSWLSILGGYKTIDTFVSEMENNQPVGDDEDDE